jgi:mannose-6-phosphate isomerase-like protein (cupin superfamily)
MSSEDGTTSTRRRTIIVGPDEGTILQAFGDTVQVKLSGDDTNGTMVLGLGTTPPGQGPPPHIHHREDELFIVLEGSFRFFGADGWSEPVGRGGIAYTPRGVLHTFQNAGTETGRQWVLATPSGFERFFGQCAEVFALGGVPNMERILAIAAEHELEFVPPLTSRPVQVPIS